MVADSKPSGRDRDRDDAPADSKHGDHKRDIKQRGDKAAAAAAGGVDDDRPITGSGAGVTAVSDGHLLGGAAVVSGGVSLKALSDYGPIPDEPAGTWFSSLHLI
jgi:hypothetical protein